MQQHVHRAGDDLQQVVEIVGDAAGELADGLQLLRLPQLLACAYQLQVRLACLFGDGGNLAAVHVALDHPLGERPERFPQRTVAVHHQWQVVEAAMGAGKRIINGLRHVLPDVCPDGLQAVAHRAVQLVTQHRQIGVVEEERFFIMAPRDPQRLGRVEDHRQQGAQFGRRTRGGGGTGPIAVLQQPVGQLVGCGDGEGKRMHGRRRGKVRQHSRVHVSASCTGTRGIGTSHAHTPSSVGSCQSATRAWLTCWWQPQRSQRNRAPPGSCSRLCSLAEVVSAQCRQVMVSAVMRSTPPDRLTTASKARMTGWIESGMDISAGAHGVSLPKGSDGAVSCVHAAGQADAAVAAPLPGRRDGRRAASGDADQQQAAQHQHQHEYAPAQRQAGQARRQGPRRQQRRWP
ncbi:hypothetical protein G6F22_012827 [Rhizopus arrhizus]|nr:hypothetical protein G6F22_012827 [Rhizopus arrhizus]